MRDSFLLRGTKAWDDREEQRRAMGCNCLSFGSIHLSLSTNGRSAGQRNYTPAKKHVNKGHVRSWRTTGW